MDFQHCLMQWTGLILLRYIPLRDLVNTVMTCRLP